MKIGFLVNPVAGMGGRVGLKGTDDVVDEARERGAEPIAGERGRRSLEHLHSLDVEVEIVAAEAAMGGDIVEDTEFTAETVDAGGWLYETSANDTYEAVEDLVEEDVDILLFVGGDGTAVDVADALDDLDSTTPALGVPAGVKVYSEVFAETPEDAAEILASYEETEASEVVDADEDRFRDGEVELSTHGVLHVPVDPRMQATKSQVSADTAGLAEGFAAEADADTTYVLGPGGTTAELKEALGFTGTPLGVDVWRDGDVVARDASAKEILDSLGDRNVVVVSPIGGQGFVLGRGNQQITPEILRRSELQILSSPEKLQKLEGLKVDTGDPEIDEELRGWHRVRVGRYDYTVETVE